MDDRTSLDCLRRAAGTALDAWPEAKAAVLFGSRARGDHRTDSDWDVAFITEGDGDRCGTLPAHVPFPVDAIERDHDVSPLSIPEDLVFRKALCIGRVSRGVAADGRILAGKWMKPSVEGIPYMEASVYRTYMATSLEKIGNAAAVMARAGKSKIPDNILNQADIFTACTANAAEFLVKAMMGRHGLDPQPKHSLDILAAQARKAGHSVLAERIRKMNGFTAKDHVARYEGVSAERLVHALARFSHVMAEMQEELRFCRSGYPDPRTGAGLVVTAHEFYEDCVSVLREAIDRDGTGMRLSEPFVWIQPLIDARSDSMHRLDSAVRALNPDISVDSGSGMEPP